MLMDMSVTVMAANPGREARELRRWLAAEEELHGHVWLAELMPQPGSLGALTDTLMVSLGPGGAATVFAAALISWIRHRTADTQVVVKRPDGAQVEVSAQRVRGLDAASVQAMVNDLAASLSDPGGTVGIDSESSGS